MRVQNYIGCLNTSHKAKGTHKRSKMHKIVLFTATIAFLSIITISAQAQMFSVGDQTDRVVRPSSNTLMIGLAPMDFSWKGDGINPNVPLDYNDLMFRAILESPSLNVHLAYGKNMGTSKITAFNIGATVSNKIGLNRGSKTMVYIPVRLITDWRTVRNTTRGNSNDEFQQSSFLVGSGVGAYLRVKPKQSIDLSANANYGYSARSFGAEGGQTALMDIKARYLIDNLSKSLGLSFGYDYTFQDYYIDSRQFEYRLSGHSILVGIRF
jgi:hypothetical protein